MSYPVLSLKRGSPSRGNSRSVCALKFELLDIAELEAVTLIQRLCFCGKSKDRRSSIFKA
jgi:hypothetical protein